MTCLSAKDFPPEVLQLFDRYVHGDISRRGFLERAATLAGSAAAAAGLLAALNPQFAQAQQVAPGDARLQTRYQVFDAPDGNGAVRGYLARPCSSSTRTVDSTRTLKTSLVAWLSMDFWPLRLTLSILWVVIREMKTRPASSLQNWMRARR